MHIRDVCFNLSKMFIGFDLLDKSFFVSLHVIQSLIREKRITLPAHRFSDVILREPVDQVYVRPQQILDARHMLDNEAP
jgi:hypothetical protein